MHCLPTVLVFSSCRNQLRQALQLKNKLMKPVHYLRVCRFRHVGTWPVSLLISYKVDIKVSAGHVASEALEQSSLPGSSGCRQNSIPGFCAGCHLAVALCSLCIIILRLRTRKCGSNPSLTSNLSDFSLNTSASFLLPLLLLHQMA